MSRSEEQAARNEATFRDANEQIATRRAELSAVEGKTPFLCECEDDRCTEIVRLSPEEYEAVRAVPTHFVIVHGHPTHGSRVVREGDGWVCIDKDGTSAQIARATDSRSH